ncbi:MAG: hypothetical protein NW202_06055 [Nitrospira sp.]|nr:hypothetical protein [Nitrospira sp.]
MDSPSPKGTTSHRSASGAPSPLKERVITLVLIGAVLLYALWTLRAVGPAQDRPVDPGTALMATLSPEKMPLTTGEEPIDEIFTRAGCPVCHTIPGIAGANGQVGPKLVLGTTGTQRISNSAYRGQATTVRDYVVESVLDPERYIVPGYPGRTMPAWYGLKLSALALEKIATYLEQQTEGEQPG